MTSAEPPLPPGLIPNPMQRVAPWPRRGVSALSTAFVVAGLGFLSVALEAWAPRSQPPPRRPRTVQVVLTERPPAPPSKPDLSRPELPGGAGPRLESLSMNPKAFALPSRLQSSEDRDPLEAASLDLPGAVAARPAGGGTASGAGSGAGLGSGSGSGGGGGAGLVRSSRELGEIVALKDVDIHRYVAPEYPNLAVSARVEGDVPVRVTLDERGRLVHFEILSGHPAFFNEVNRVLPLWRFNPVKKDGRAVQATFEVVIRFTIQRT